MLAFFTTVSKSSVACIIIYSYRRERVFLFIIIYYKIMKLCYAYLLRNNTSLFSMSFTFVPFKCLKRLEMYPSSDLNKDFVCIIQLFIESLHLYHSTD